MSRSTTAVARNLFSKALEQGGYFTAKQAKEIGYAYPHLAYHESTGNFERVGHGLYRLTSRAPGEHDDLVRLSLWSRDRADRMQAVVSHDSALVLHELSELLPATIHLTVPGTFRKPAPRGVVLHKASLAGPDIEERSGFRLTTPMRTLVDAAIGEVSQEQLEKAVSEALRRGLVRKSKLGDVVRNDPRLLRLRQALDGIV
jgi:predicted transcriptional regulator of viral defense system